jgi:hypothetical protein
MPRHNHLEPLGFDTVVDEALRLTEDDRIALLTVLSASVVRGEDIADAILANQARESKTPTFDLVRNFALYQEERKPKPDPEPWFEPPNLFIVFGSVLLGAVLLSIAFGYKLGLSDANDQAISRGGLNYDGGLPR